MRRRILGGLAALQTSLPIGDRVSPDIKEFELRSWKFWAGLLISVIFLALALRGLDLERFWRTLRDANYWWLIPAVAIYFLTVLVRTWRWHAMLYHIKRIPVLQLFPVVVIGYMGNNVYPARAGEVLRSYVLRRKEGVSMSASLATVILERLFDGLVMLLFVAITLPFAPLPALYNSLVLGLSVIFGIALFVFLAVAAHPERLSWLYTWLVDRILPVRLRPSVHGLFDRFVEGLQSLRSPREMLAIFFTSVLIWLGETLKYWIVMQAFPFSVSFPVLMLMTALVNLVTTIPSTPGYVGTFDAAGIAILTRFGVEQAIATGYTLVLHVALWLPITVLGAFFMVRESVSWRDIQTAATTQQEGAIAPAPSSPQLTSSETEHEDIATRVST
jgi:hypothetical protein